MAKYVSRAAFVAGTYSIDPALGMRSAAIAAAHEEAHGIIRRSTLYGWLLNHLVGVRTHDLAASDVFGHKLFSRGRTSEEIFATFSGLNGAIFHGDQEAYSRELGDNPEYRYYYDIGADLTSAFADPLIKDIVLEGVVRFCWSSVWLEGHLDPLDRAALDQIPAAAVPDVRLKRLISDWSTILVDGFVDACFRQPVFAALRGRSASQLFNPLHDLNLDGMIVNDADRVVEQQSMKQRTMVSLMQGRAVEFAADYLADRYEGTELAALSVARSTEWLDRRSAPARRDALNLIERVRNLADRRKVQLQPALELNRDNDLAFIGIRSRESFISNFGPLLDVGTGDQSHPHMVYAAPYRLSSGPLHQVDEEEVVDMAWRPLPPEVSITAMVRSLVADRAVVAIWSSIVLADLPRWRDSIRDISRSGCRPWIVVDTDPQITLSAIEPLINEVRAFGHIPVLTKPGLGGLAVGTIAETPCGLRGLVFMGMLHTLKMIEIMIGQRLKDNFRGIGGPIFHSWDRQNHFEGRALVRWLAQHEFVFEYKRSS